MATADEEAGTHSETEGADAGAANAPDGTVGRNQEGRPLQEARARPRSAGRDRSLLSKRRSRTRRPTIAVPGFRPGHVPAKLVEKRFRSELAAKVKQRVLLESMEQLSDEPGPRSDQRTRSRRRCDRAAGAGGFRIRVRRRSAARVRSPQLRRPDDSAARPQDHRSGRRPPRREFPLAIRAACSPRGIGRSRVTW